MVSNYCYPVLSAETGDYSVESSFGCQLEAKVIANNVHLYVDFNLTDETLLRAVEDGSAAYSLLLKCSRSSYRRHHLSEKRSAEIVVRGSDIDITGRMEIMPALIAVRNIDDYENESLNKEYEGTKISIPRLGYLAVAPVQSITVKRRDPFKTPESVIRFDKRDDDNPFATKILYADEGDYITIYLSSEMLEKYEELPKNIKEIFSAVYAIPIIADIIQRHWIDEMSLHVQEYRWYDILSERLNFNYKTGVKNAYEAAVMIFSGFSEEVLNTVHYEFSSGKRGDEFDNPGY